MNPSSRLDQRLREISTAPVLLVATDFDGTVAPIVPRYEDATADRDAIVALRMLSQLPHTFVAVISGRSLDDLSKRMDGASDFHLIGSHGSEFESGFAERLTEADLHLLEAIRIELEPIVARFPGSRIELKPGALAFHFRELSDEEGAQAEQAVMLGPGRRHGVQVRQGKKVVEFSVVPANKGLALDRIRQRVGATVVVYLGDDVTDEDAFAALSGPDLGLKIGSGGTSAKYRVPERSDVSRLLARLAEARAEWLAGRDAEPIESHAMLSDQRSIALLTQSGRISWFCSPRIDSSALFAELVGGPPAGFFEIREEGSSRPIRQRNDGDTFTVITEWPNLRVIDYLDAANGRAFQRAGRTDLVRVVEGAGRAAVTFGPRLDFGRIPTRLSKADGGLVVEGAREPIVLYTPGVEFEIVQDGAHQTAYATLEATGRPIEFELRCGTRSLAPTMKSERIRRDSNQRFWSSFASTLVLPTRFAQPVKRSALILKALTYGPTGAIAAAATTSLPECRGGVRNWDYRFCWPRDAAIASQALALIGAIGIGSKFLDWLIETLERTSSEPGSIDLPAPAYSVTGAHLSPEAELTHLAGYAGSRPVRLSNAASQQIQLDVLGPVVALVAELAKHGAPISVDHFRLVELAVESVRARWMEPDHGIWEIRLPKRHHVHSRVSCWLAVDRALVVAHYLGVTRDGWVELANEIKNDILDRGFHRSVNAFGTSYEDPAADAAALITGLSGMIAPDDPRFIGTVDWVERNLKQGSAVYRYRFDDGLPGREGAFNIATTWFIESLALLGRYDEAESLFADYLRLAGPTGLIAEEFDPETKAALGNVPQAYSHAGLIFVAHRLSTRAEH